MRVAGPHLPFVPTLVMDTGRGKLSSHIDLRDESGRETLRALAQQADVFVQGYRPGAIAGHGFGAEQVASVGPGITFVSLCAYGYEGRWRDGGGCRNLSPMVSATEPGEGGG